MRDMHDVALKEWAVICRELAAGRHIVLLRKGGIREPSRGFSLEHREFFLFPTYVHENAEELTDTARAALPGVTRSAPHAGIVRLELYATVEDVTEVHHLSSLRALAAEHPLRWPAVERRFNYRRPGLCAIALRVYRLPRALELPNLARYDGCRSWVTLETTLPLAGSIPVLDERRFGERLSAVRAALSSARSETSARRSG